MKLVDLRNLIKMYKREKKRLEKEYTNSWNISSLNYHLSQEKLLNSFLNHLEESII